MRQEGYEYADRCAHCGSRDIGGYWSSIEGHLCNRCADDYRAEKAKRKAERESRREAAMKETT